MTLAHRTNPPMAALLVVWLVALPGGFGAPVAAISEFPIPTPFAGARDIVTGPDGNLWFTEYTANRIGMVSPSGTFLEIELPLSSGGLHGIAAGLGALWFVEEDGNNLGRVTTSGSMTEFAIPTQNSQPRHVVLGPDGRVWFTECQADQIGAFDPATQLFTEYPMPAAGSCPNGIASGPDGALWFTELTGQRIGRVSLSGNVTEFPIPTPNSAPYHIVSGPDGNLWFTEFVGNRIAKITTSGIVTEFLVPTRHSGADGIAVAGPWIWFTEYKRGWIGRVSISGAFAEVPIPTTGSGPEGITRGPDHAVWFVEHFGGNVGRLGP